MGIPRESGKRGYRNYRKGMDWDNYAPALLDQKPRDHHGRVKVTEREFLCWDGEGADANGEAQKYVLLGNSTGDMITSPELHTSEMLAFIIEQARANPYSIHVGFAFEYDVNMILCDLSLEQFHELRDTGYVHFENYRIQHVPAKWLQITELSPVDPEQNYTVRISDVFGFFQCSFLKAINTYIPDSPTMAKLAIVEAGKASRNVFTYEELPTIIEYWRVEIQLFLELVNKLRTYMYSAGFMVTMWHGPGALANYIYRTNDIQRHKADNGTEIYDAARYAYAGGRFELFNLGRHENVYSYDINSAYPTAIAMLPSLSEGYWRKVDNPTAIVEFGMYHVRMAISESTAPAPLFHRNKNGNIVYSWITEGWYWSPEVAHLLTIPGVEIVAGYEYVGWSTRPFTFVPEFYRIRKEHKRKGEGVQMAYKLGLNSLYGKMAQRVGGRDGAPKWHQLEWAGWVTSYTRAMLYGVMKSIPMRKLVAVETDGLYTTATPEELGLTNSEELGGWEIGFYDEMMYLQSGMYAYRVKDKWSAKYRGLDKGSLEPEIMMETLKNTGVGEWPTLMGPTTRFVGYRSALTHGDDVFHDYHRHWIKSDKEISFGRRGKRIHVAGNCPACLLGENAYSMPHQLSIAPVGDPVSARHDIPWLPGEESAWRAEILAEDAPWNVRA